MNKVDEVWERKRQYLQAAVRKAALDLFEHTSSESFRIPLDPPHQKLWVYAGPQKEAITALKETP